MSDVLVNVLQRKAGNYGVEGGGDVITFDGTFTHGRYYMFSELRARTHTHTHTHTHMLVARPQGCRSAVAHVLSITCQGLVPSLNLTTHVIMQKVYTSIII